MKLNKTKGLALLFIVGGSVVYFTNGRIYTGYVLGLKSIGFLIFLYAIYKDSKTSKG